MTLFNKCRLHCFSKVLLNINIIDAGVLVDCYMIDNHCPVNWGAIRVSYSIFHFEYTNFRIESGQETYFKWYYIHKLLLVGVRICAFLFNLR